MATSPKKILFTTVTLLGIWGAFELIAGNFFLSDLRSWAAPPPTNKNQRELTLYGNPYLIFENVPGKWTTSNQHVNFTANVNQLGFRAPEVTIPKPDGVRRLITTGDSSVYGFGVNDDEVFSSVTATMLGSNVEPLNAAVPGYSSFQTINLLRMRGMKTEPDLIVCANIWSDNNFDAFVDKDILDLYTGFQESFTGKAKRVLSKSAIFRVLDWKLRLSKTQSNIQQKRKVGWQVGSADHIGLRRVSINDYAKNLDTIAQMALSVDAEIAFVLLANEEDLSTKRGGDKAWTPYRQVMMDTARRYGAPLIKVPEIYRASGLSKEDLFLDEMHPTPKGHALMGEALGELLASYDWQNGGSILQEGDNSSLKEYQDPFLKGGITDNAGAVTGLSNQDDNGVPRLVGTVKYDAYEGGSIQIDILSAQVREAQVLNMIQLPSPGPFAIPIGAHKKVAIRAYIDSEGDGPDADDPLIDLSSTVLHLDHTIPNNLIIDLDKKEVRSE